MSFITQGKTNWKLLLIVIVSAVIAGGGILVYQYLWVPKQEVKNVACTQEAKLCPDGSYVSRTGSNCEFAKCPIANTYETADWQTYRNEYFGFKFKYPSSYATSLAKYKSDFNGNYVLIDPSTTLKIVSSDLSLEEYYTAEKNDEFRYGTTSDPEIFSIDGHKAIKFAHTHTYYNWENDDNETRNFYEETKIYIYLSQEGRVYKFSYLSNTSRPGVEIDGSQLGFFYNIVSTFKFLNLIRPENLSFTPLHSQPSPNFINSTIAKDIKIDFFYEGEYLNQLQGSGFYIPTGGTEKFLDLSKTIKEEGTYSYGPKYYSIFTAMGSHLYQGTPIYLLNADSKYSVSYVGFQINNKDLISELKVEFGIDYRGGDYGVNESKSSIFASIFGIESVYACGPGIYLRPVGNSNLTFVEESNGISWYRLEKPVALYNLSLHYCDNPDPDYCYYDMSISSLAEGNLKMHILYKPNNKEGFLKLQMVNLIVSDPTGVYYQPTMGKDFDHYYRAHLH